MNKRKPATLAVIFLSFLSYLFFGYFLDRSNFLQLISAYLLLFASYLFFIRRSDELNLKFLISLSLAFRLVLLFSFPQLSDDYFRFIWDGKMITLLHNPYTVVPSTFIRHSNQVNELLEQLYSRMNSPDYHTVYPPFAQFIFAGTAFLSPNNLLGGIVLLRIICIAADFGSILLIQKLLAHFELPKKNVLWYALNPLVILELTGNLHFECVMIFFLLLAVHVLLRGGERRPVQTFLSGSNPQIFLSAVSYGLAISTKLIPLLFLPFIIRRLKWKSIIYFPVIGSTCLILWIPFLDRDLIADFSSSVDLYFQKFEFNASVYYIIRWIGFQVKGYNIIESTGPWLAVTVFVLIMTLAAIEKKISWKNLFLMMQWSLTIYLLLATTVHPWYVTTLVVVSLFTNYRYTVVWSLMIMLSYATYQAVPPDENLWLTAVEYCSVLVFIGIEFRQKFFREKDSMVELQTAN